MIASHVAECLTRFDPPLAKPLVLGLDECLLLLDLVDSHAQLIDLLECFNLRVAFFAQFDLAFEAPFYRISARNHWRWHWRWSHLRPKRAPLEYSDDLVEDSIDDESVVSPPASRQSRTALWALWAHFMGTQQMNALRADAVAIHTNEIVPVAKFAA